MVTSCSAGKSNKEEDYNLNKYVYINRLVLCAGSLNEERTKAINSLGIFNRIYFYSCLAQQFFCLGTDAGKSRQRTELQTFPANVRTHAFPVL